MNICSRCGRDSPPDARFCSSCGALIPVRTSAETVRVQSIPPDEPRETSVLLDRLQETALGEYEILEELGRGGMAVVYLAHDLALERKVAIKVISPSLLALGPGMAERFKREARTVAALSHPNIIPIYAVKESQDLLFFVMKYVKGRTLESVLAEVDRLPIPMVHTIVSHVGSALGYAHRHGVIHRDIKPGNVMLDEEGWAVVTDFGIAKVDELDALTQTGGTVGTPAYMSPEQCAGAPLTGASDQYSLGIVAYEMVSGRKAFEADSAMAIMYKHCNTPPEPLGELAPDCPKHLAAAVMRMLQKGVEDRWPHLEAMIGAIGPVPQTESDHVRTQMLTLARSSGAHRLLAKFTTPASPVPPDRLSNSIAMATPGGTITPSEVEATIPDTHPAVSTGKRRSVLLGVVPVLLIAAVTLLAWGPWRNSADVDAEGEAPAPVEAAQNPGPSAPPVVSAVLLTPPVGSMAVGDSMRLAATVRDSDGTDLTGVRLQWVSSDAAVIAVDDLGRVKAVGPGTALISARAQGREARAEITVERPTPAPAQPTPTTTTTPLRATVATVSIAPTPDALTVGQIVQLTANVRDGSGGALTDRAVLWNSSDEGIATVSSSGSVRAVAPGTVRISASSEGRTTEVGLTIVPAPVASVTVSPNDRSVEVATTLQLTAVLRDAAGNPLRDRSVSWESSDPAIATVSPNGGVVARGPGRVTVTARTESRSGTVTITVVRPVDATPTAPVDPTPAVEAAIRDYGDAIETMDIAQLRRVYPGMTSTQEQAWGTFFHDARELSASLVIRDMRIDGDTAIVEVEATYDYRTNRRQQQEARFQATIVRTGQSWRLARIQ